jgi:hypothetical protein
VRIGYLRFRESDPRPKGPGPGFSDFIFSYCAISFGTFLILIVSLQAGFLRDIGLLLGRLHGREQYLPWP